MSSSAGVARGGEAISAKPAAGRCSTAEIHTRVGERDGALGLRIEGPAQRTDRGETQPCGMSRGGAGLDVRCVFLIVKLY